MDMVFRKLLHMVAGAPGNLDWSRPWHAVLHEWNMKVEKPICEHQMKLWPRRCLESCRKFWLRIVYLPAERWVQTVLRWKAAGARVTGHPRHDWTCEFQSHTRLKSCNCSLSLENDVSFCFRTSDVSVN